jgi:glc operon protein GlcG
LTSLGLIEAAITRTSTIASAIAGWAAISATQRCLGHGITLKCDEHGARFSLHQASKRRDLVPTGNETGVKAEANSRKTTGATMKLAIGVGILATIFCLSVRAQTISELVLDQAGAQTVLQAAREIAQQRNAPSAIAVVDPAGDLLAFQRMDRVRPASVDLAVEKARTAARLQRPTAEIEDNIDHGRTAFVTAGIMALRGGVPIRVNGEVVGAVGVAGLSKETDTDIANTAAAALSPDRRDPQHN